MSKRRPVFVSPFSSVLDGPLSATLADDVTEDERFLAQALDEAERALGRTWPNPPVGAVVVKRGRVVGAGHHVAAGKAHAEVAALDQAGASAKGATLYVSLEPCTHHGRTPPCADRVLKDGLARVVIGVRDPNPTVSGRGVAKLRRHGVEVQVLSKGPVAARARALIEPFGSTMQRSRPWVIVKVAATLDGRIATRTGHSRWITGPDARRLVHALRDRVDGIVVGSGTALADDPSLTVRELPRGARGRNPVRVLVDGALRVPASAKMLSSQPGDPEGRANAIVLHTTGASSSRARALAEAGIETLACGEGDHVDIEGALVALRQRGLTSLLVEPGPLLLGALVTAGLVDEVWWFTAPALVGEDGRAAAPLLGVTQMDQALRLSPGARLIQVGADALFVGAPDLGDRALRLPRT